MKPWLQLLTPTGDAVLVNKSVYVASLHFPRMLYFDSFIIKFILRMFSKGICFEGPWLVMYLSFGPSGKRRSPHGCEWGGHFMGHLPPQAEDGEQGTLKFPYFQI